jgi:exodeoxyribonuclease-5
MDLINANQEVLLEEEDIFYPDVEFGQAINSEIGATIVQEPKYELFPGVYANQGQREAIDLLTDFLGSPKKEFLLQGKGGTGKTTIIKKILEEAQKKNLRVLGVAPTHKAKKVLNKSMPNVKTVTLASALAIKLDETTGSFVADEFARSRGRVPIKGGDLIIIDESSMISDKLLQELRTLANSGSKIIFMGDRAQLPPVGQESDSNVFKVDNGYELTEKMRQAATSPIIGIGSKIAANVESTGQRVANPITEQDRVSKTDAVSGSSITWESSENKALDSFVEDIKNANGDVNYAKIVTFNNQSHNSPQSVKNLNNKVRYRLFGQDAADNQFMPGELLTAYDTYGGEDPIFFNSEDLIVKSATDLGPKNYVVRAYSASKGERTLNITVDSTELELINEEGKVLDNPVIVVSNKGKADFANTLAKLFKTDPQMAYALKDKFGNLEYGYAVTSHKAQGSTYTNVYVMEDNIMGPSNGGTVKSKNQSLYVAVSRPTTKLVMVSQKNSGVASKPKLNLSGLQNAEEFMQMPPELGDNYGGPSAEDWDMLNRMRDQDESLADSPINKELYEKYLLLCGK